MSPIGGLVKLQFLKEILVSRFWSLFMAEPLKGSALRILLVASSSLVSRFLINVQNYKDCHPSTPSAGLCPLRVTWLW